MRPWLHSGPRLQDQISSSIASEDLLEHLLAHILLHVAKYCSHKSSPDLEVGSDWNAHADQDCRSPAPVMAGIFLRHFCRFLEIPVVSYKLKNLFGNQLAPGWVGKSIVLLPLMPEESNFF